MENKRTYRVQGMHCASCARNIETLLNREEHVESATVNLSTEMLYVTYRTFDADLERKLRSSVEKLGYSVTPDDIETLVLHIEGMHCASCSANIERRLNAAAGVEEATVNLNSERVQVRFRASMTDEQTVASIIEELGYRVQSDTLRKARQQRSDDRQEQRTLIAVFAFAVPLFLVSMGPMLGLSGSARFALANPAAYAFLQLALTVPVMLLARSFYVVGFRMLWQRIPNMDSLVALGTSAAFLYSLVNTVRIATGVTARAPLYYESAGVILSLIMLGKYFEKRARKRTSRAVERLGALRSKTAIRLENGVEREVDVSQVRVGDHLVVKPGTTVPVDGHVIEGSSSVDESMITGESMPVSKQPGSSLTGATVNGSGAMVMEAKRIGEDTVLFQIIRMVEQAQGDKAPIARMADRVSAVFVPIVMAIATAAFAAWMVSGQSLSFSLTVFVSVLVIACPCALGLATPTAILVGTGQAAKMGILFKGGVPLENLGRADVLVLDKTGTITEGKPRIIDEQAYADHSLEDLYALARLLEERSEHPLAHAVLSRAREQEPSERYRNLSLRDVRAVEGKGVVARTDQDGEASTVWLGSMRFAKEQSVAWPDEARERVRDMEARGETVMVLAMDGRLVGLLGAKDNLKPGVRQTLERIRARGIQTVLLTGDHKAAALRIAEEAGIDDVRAEVLPKDKMQTISQLQERYGSVAMVGDGINDAPALVQADVGIAIGQGTDVAVESADVVLMNDDIGRIDMAFEVSRKTLRNIKQNLFWAFFYNTLGIPVAAGIFYPVSGLLLSPMLAAGAMSLSSVSVVGNALRLRGILSFVTRKSSV